jgi:hypothetical protein
MTASTPRTPAPSGLSDADQVEALADQLSSCADELHARVMKAIRSGGGDTPGIARELARSMLDEEALLRQRADALYADAAAHAVQGLGQTQQHVMALTAAACEQIRKIGLIGDATGLVASMLALAGAAASGQAAAIVLALEDLKRQSDAVAAHSPPAPAAAPLGGRP